MGLFLALIVGTFNYLGYDEGEVPSEEADRGVGRGLAEDSQHQKEALDLSQQNKSGDSHQDQTHQLQVCLCETAPLFPLR